MNYRTAIAALSLLGCPMPESTDDDVGDESTETESTSTDSDTTETEGGCPVGLEGCPCSDASTCFPALECVDGLCIPADPCPIGASGCPCTNFGTCDPGSTCVDGTCECEAGELGCECLDGGCSNALDCVDGVCAIPELISEAANGWGPVTCWADRGAATPSVGGQCFAFRGDVVHDVRPACEIAELLVSQEWMPFGTWEGAGWPVGCADGTAAPAPAPPWDDAGCFLSGGGEVRCFGRLGHLWVGLVPECSAPPMNAFPPWGDFIVDNCVVPDPAPADNDVDEWRCGPVMGLANDICMARYGDQWTRPYPPCYVDPIDSPLATVFNQQPHDGWSVFQCL
jgi:hypothetical protein